MGGLTEMAPNTPFRPESDIDVGVLVATAPRPGQETFDEPYRGMVIEAGLRHVSMYETAAKVLANPDLANHIAAGAVLADPLGLIGAIQPAVERDFAAHRWVVARCNDEKQRVDFALSALRAAPSPPDYLFNLLLTVQSLTGLIAISMLRLPTHRRCLVRFREQLHLAGRPEIAEECMAVLGFAEMPRPVVTRFHDRGAIAFDRALQVHRTPVPFDFKLRHYLRPYAVDSVLPMIEGEDYREAMWWIALGIGFTYGVLMNDAPGTERPAQNALLGDLLGEMGIGTPSQRLQRLGRVEALRHAVVALADELTAVTA